MPISASAGQGLGGSQNSLNNDCIDSDGDNVPDYLDLDDDNDGILDAIESPSCFYTAVEANQISSVVSSLNGGAGRPQAGNNIPTLFNGNNNDGTAAFNFVAGQALVTGTPIFTIRYPTPVALSNMSVIQTANGISSTAFGRLYGSNDGVNYTLLTTATNAVSLSTATVSFANTSTTTFIYYQIRYTGTNVTNATSGTTGSANIHEITSTLSTSVAYIPSANPKPGVCGADTDGDGIPNHLDLDSDNDGCPDGLEGASFTIRISDLVDSAMPGGNSGATSGSFNQPVIQNLGNVVNTTPGSASLGVPTIADAGQGLGQSQNSSLNDCIDTDGDNVPDYMDLDDDNDGILDAIESPSCFYNIVEANQISSVVSSLNGGAGRPQAGNNIPTLTNGNNNDGTAAFNFVAGQALVTGTPIFTIRYPTPVALGNVSVIQAANGISSTAFGRLYGSNDGVNYTLLTTATNAISLSTATVSFANTSTTTYTYYQIRYTGTNATNTTSGTSGSASIHEITSTLSTAVVYNPSANPKPGICGADTDGDGIPNHLDLDSDNDGCPDALEGTGNFTAAQLTTASGTLATQNPNRNFGIAVNQSTGIPTVAGAGQGFGFSQNARISVCLDSDNDGIIDLYDLDDDNDGITDAAECGGGAVFNYSGFGVRTVGTQTDLYGFAGTDSAPVLLSSAVLGASVTANHLATDATRNRLLFTVNGAQGAISAYNFGTQTISTASSADFLSLLGTSSGGGAMYNGDYYIYDDTGDTTNQGIYRITFDNAGNANSLVRIAEPVVGADLGDLAINSIGMAHIIAGGQLYKLDLTAIYSGAPAPSSSWTLVGSVGSSTSSQLFFRGNGELIGSNSGSLIRINPNTGANEGTVLSLTGFAWGDLSEGPTIGFTCSTDTDGDGIPNHLDLDSDNDGCPDAIEGDGPFLNANLVTASGPISAQSPNRNLGNTIGSTAATFGIPTVAGTGQAVGNSQSNLVSDCRDSDGDGILDVDDLDDDNDGILDAVESPNCFYTATEANTIASVTSPFNGTSPDPQAGNNIPTLFNGSTTDANPFNFAGSQTVTPGTTIFTITYPTTVLLSSLNINKAATGIAGTGFGRLFGSNNGVDYTAISPTGVDFNTANLLFNNPTTNAYKYYRIVYVGTVAGGNATNLTLGTGAVNEITSVISSTYIPSAHPKPGICSADFDGDGIPNHLDLDSDGDGCTDAVEGGASFKTTDLVAATGTLATQTPNQNLGNSVNTTVGSTSYGVPNVALTGQTVGNSQSFSKNDCLDSDGDGIPDWEDVDDDNDGILDTAECSNTFGDLLTAFGAGRLLDVTPSDFGLGLGVRNQNITRDISTKFGYPANSGAVVISITNPSVHPTQDAWWTKFGESQSVWKVTGTMSAFVLMTQNPEYYGSDSKTIHIYDGDTVIPVTGTNIPGQDNQTPSAQWSTNLTATAKTLTNLQPEDSSQANIKIGQWRFANMNFGPKTFGFSTTTRFADPTYAVNMYLECDSDLDGIPDRLDLDSDADGCPDALEGGASLELSQLITAGGTLTGGSTNVTQNICTACVSTGGVSIGLPQLTSVSGYSNTTGQTVGGSKDSSVNSCPTCSTVEFIEDFGTSNLSVNFGRATSPYMPSGSFAFATPSPASNDNNETAIDNNHYAVVAPGYIKAGWRPDDLGYYFWTPAYDETGTVRDKSNTEQGGVMAVNAGSIMAPFYRREVVLEYDTYYHAAFSIYVKNQPSKVGIKVGNTSTGQVYGMMFSQDFSTNDSGWQTVELAFKVPADADVNCDMQNVYLEFFNAKAENSGNDYYIDNIYLEKLSVGGSCPAPSSFVTLVCPSGGGGCTNDPNTDTGGEPTKVGITNHDRLPQWPESIPNGFVALESASKGFVITRVDSESNIAEPIEGMLIYDKTESCVKLYRENAWSCLEQYCYNNSAVALTLLCNSVKFTGTLNAGVNETFGTFTADLPYANGDGAAYTAQNIASVGVTGLTASLNGGNFVNGTGGQLIFTIHGTPSATGIARFPITINGYSCEIQAQVLP